MKGDQMYQHDSLPRRKWGWVGRSVWNEGRGMEVEGKVSRKGRGRKEGR